MKYFVLFSLISVIAAQTITLTGTCRDFTPAHPDFEHYLGAYTGMVLNDLDSNGKPVLNPNNHPVIASPESFAQWYRDTDGVNIPIQITLTLTNNGNGIYTYSNDNFFPIDGQGFGNYGGYGHNFGFTTEFATEFTYQGTEVFSFSGDDDVWVFVNRKLALDLGGVHGPQGGSITLSSLGLTVGQTYPLHIFQAERHTSGSTFSLSTSLAVHTQPTQVCGNGRVEGTEQCDGGSCCTTSCTFVNTASCFCGRQTLADGAMEYYCDGNGGFFQCLGGVFAPQSRQMACAAGTSCGCAAGAPCSCNLTRSPCVWAGTAQTC